MKHAIQICGTGSGVGKSIISAALCRIFLEDGFSVAPFKAQNMSLNSFVTEDGGEMGRAQVVQAQACRIAPHVDMNPVLIKPTADAKAQVIVQGRPKAFLSAASYVRHKNRIFKKVADSFNRLKKAHDIIVIEGAGSPAEVNLKKHDIVNLRMSAFSGAAVILVGDIDRGGVFASIVGTLELLDPDERKRIKGFIINKFRGDKRLLAEGLSFLERRTKKPVLGVVPYFKDIRIPEEDSVALEERGHRAKGIEQRAKVIDVAVIKLPHISNFTDFDALENEPDVKLSYIDNSSQLDGPDMIIIPGTKNTIEDLLWLKRTGLAKHLLSTLNSKLSAILIGICGGYQMLGEFIYDPHGIESSLKSVEGLGLLPIATELAPDKTLSQVKAKELATGLDVFGYEIHHGRTKYLASCERAFEIVGTKRLDGAKDKSGRIWGTYIHGLFDNHIYRRGFLNRLRKKKSLHPLPCDENYFSVDDELNKLASLVRENINIKLLYKILNDGL